MREMTPEERRAFLMEGTRTGKIAITRRDGPPYVLSVWFVLDGETPRADWHQSTTNPLGGAVGRLSCSRPGPRPFAAGRCAAMTGPRCASTKSAHPTLSCASTVERGLGEDLAEMRLWARRIAARYMGEAVADRYAARNAVPGELLVRLVPAAVVGRKGVAD